MHYGYVLNDPVNFVDPTGEIVPAILAAAGVGAVVGATVGVVNAVFTDGSVWKGALSGAAVGSLAGFTFGTSLLANALIGAGIGVGCDILTQKWSNPCKPIYWTSVVISGIAGAVGFGSGTAMLKGGATAADAALISGALSGGVSTGLNATAEQNEMVPYKP